MSELKDYDIMDIEAFDDERIKASSNGMSVPATRVYIKAEVDSAIDELKREHHRERHEYIEMVAQIKAKLVEQESENRKLKRALWLSRAERYKMREFIAREEANLVNKMSWSQILRERTYNQWVGQLLRIANLANKLQNKCRAKAEEYK